MALAFCPALPLSAFRPTQSRCHQAHTARPRRRSQRVICLAKPKKSAQVKTPDIASLQTQLRSALRGLNRGLAIDADADTMGAQEAQVEDLIEQLENANTVPVPTKDGRMPGVWDLIYTSSSITRFFGGVTGLQRLMPDGRVGRITQIIDAEDGSAEFEEVLSCDMPFVGETTWTAVCEGKLTATNETRQLWEAGRVKVGWFSWFADSWKTVRAFQVCDTTFLDERLRITRGQTGSVNVYARAEAE